MSTKEYKTSDYLKTPEDIAAYLDIVIDDSDPKLLALALKNISELKNSNLTD